MKDTQIYNGNKLIAEFMNVEQCASEDCKGKTNQCYMYLGEPVSIYGMKYHVDFNWLMPVVEKIESLNNYSEFNEIDIYGNCCDIGGIFETVGATKIEAVYSAVIKFIETYNSNK